MKLYCLNLAVGSTTPSPTPQLKISIRKGFGLGHVTFLKNFKQYFGMDEATFFKFGKWIDNGKSHPSSNNFPSK